ncbi:uncharacterized protein PAC_07187 [Phialocephala subalpina]|uniref:Prion-inhibition and propagation HeLo domain-containing protein n=1 Tax=Phialocephala subalpina TaxID=576137 RepID=A0A1L7WX29_9HELO|nr:uncharacterized protein PAC_07187 [Phialocephala subalpina]
MVSRYGLKAEEETDNNMIVERGSGFKLFNNGSYSRLQNRIRTTRKNASNKTLTRWAIHDKTKFTVMIQDLKELIDGLVSIAISAQEMSYQRHLFQAPIHLISDIGSLRLLQDPYANEDVEIVTAAGARIMEIEGISLLGNLYRTAHLETFHSNTPRTFRPQSPRIIFTPYLSETRPPLKGNECGNSKGEKGENQSPAVNQRGVCSGSAHISRVTEGEGGFDVTDTSTEPDDLAPITET